LGNLFRCYDVGGLYNYLKIMPKIFFAIIIAFSLSSCSKSGSSDGGTTTGGSGGGGGTTVNCASVPKSFATDVDPTIQSFCNIANCHNAGSFNGPGPLTNYTQVFNARVSIRTAVSTGAMPQNATLSAAQKNSILCWIDANALNN
jgi:hypothetical protein